MPKVRIRFEQPSKVVNRNTEFDFRDVQTPNPKLMGKTPLYLYTKNPLTRDMKPKKGWWEDEKTNRR